VKQARHFVIPATVKAGWIVREGQTLSNPPLQVTSPRPDYRLLSSRSLAPRTVLRYANGRKPVIAGDIMKTAWVLSVVAVLCLLVGCKKVKYEFTINPDGSGKVAVTVRLDQNVRISAYSWRIRPAESPADEELRVKKAVLEMLKRHRGIKAWRDIEITKKDKKGQRTLTATGYFPNVAKVRVPDLKMLGRLRAVAAKDGSMSVEFVPKKEEPEQKDEEEKPGSSGDSGKRVERPVAVRGTKAARAAKVKADLKELGERMREFLVEDAADAAEPVPRAVPPKVAEEKKLEVKKTGAKKAGEQAAAEPEERAATKKKGAAKAPPAKKPVDKKVAARIKEMKEMMKTQLVGSAERWKDMEYRIVVNLPSPAKTVTNFKKVDEDTVELVFDLEAYKKLVNAVLNDEDYWGYVASNLASNMDGWGRSQPKDMQKYVEAVFGQKGGIQVVSGPATNAVFDYAAEFKIAMASYEAWKRKLTPDLPPPIARDAKFVKLRVAGVQYTLRASQKQGISPFGQASNGARIVVIGKLPGSVISIHSPILTAVEDDTGDDLMVTRGNDMMTRGRSERISNIRLSRDQTIVQFEVSCHLPSRGAKGYKVIEGKLKYLSSSGTKEVEIGPLELKAGVKDPDGLVTIIKVRKRGRSSTSLVVEFNMPMQTVKRLTYLDENEDEVEAWDSPGDGEAKGSLEDGLPGAKRKELPKTHRRQIVFYRKAPKMFRIVAELHENVSEGELPFKIENIGRLGNPMKADVDHQP